MKNARASSNITEFIERRRRINAQYQAQLAGVSGVEVVGDDPWWCRSLWLTTIRFRRPDGAELAVRVREALEEARTWDLKKSTVWKPMHKQPVFVGHQSRLTGAADRIFADGLCLPSGSEAAVSEVSQTVRDIVSALATSRRPAGFPKEPSVRLSEPTPLEGFAVLDAGKPTDRRRWVELHRITDHGEPQSHPAYAEAMASEGDSIRCAVFRDGGGVSPIHVRGCSIDARTGLLDAITPYGYGGPFVMGTPSLESFWAGWDEWAKDQSIMSLVTRSLGDSDGVPPGEQIFPLTNVVVDLEANGTSSGRVLKAGPGPARVRLRGWESGLWSTRPVAD